ncbi:uncharacterized protein LOC110457211 [Mizuhopecten yessoensis]|uniref:uncharacterized protein LOC110457211 n=1 Tax=Mizuhopecten yessoensis TaxID=6573 RepID=UPI000B45C39D|nr:uncharacterized protein LOC110457211 [Mizuhopecten yessoensis]
MTCPRIAAKDLFSVFVGHISHEVTKTDLVELFSGCGRVEDLFVVENGRAGSYNYGFVRFKKMESAVKAVKDLHRWPLRGSKLVVDLAKDTFKRIQEGNLNVEDLFGESKEETASSKGISNPVTAMSGVKSGVKDIMYVSRVRETCVSLDMDARLRMSGSPDSETRTLSSLDVDCLMEDISKAERGRVSTLPGTLPDKASIENVKEKLMLGTGEDLALGREKVKDFVSALHDVMGTVNAFLKDHQIELEEEEDKCTMNSDSVTLKDEDSLLRENQYDEDKFSDISPRTVATKDLGLMSSLFLKDIQEPVATDSSMSSDDGDTGVLGGDSGVETDHIPKSSKGGTAFIQPEISPTLDLQPEVMSEPKKPDLMSSPVVQSFLARASLGRGRGYGRGSPPLNGYGRGMATFHGYGRGVGQTF